MADEELLDLLLELQHDLGKYLRMPLSMLPQGASDAELRDALERALRQTRKGPAGVRTAREIYDGFERELGERLAGSAGLARLRGAVQRALAWERALDEAGAALDRPTLTAELGAVAQAIGALIAELREDEGD